MKSRIQPPSPWLTSRREDRGRLLPPPSLLLLRASSLGGHQLSGAQLCGWHRDAVGRWGVGWVFSGWRPDRSCGIKGFRGVDDDIVQGLWWGGGAGNARSGLHHSLSPPLFWKLHWRDTLD